MTILLFSLFSLLNWGLTFGVQYLDRRLLRAEQRARSWNVASWGVAIYWFGFLSMVPWVWVTRLEWRAWRRRGLLWALFRSALLLLAGGAAAYALLYVLSWAVEVLAAALGVKADFH